jgi:hypothetical protein
MNRIRKLAGQTLLPRSPVAALLAPPLPCLGWRPLQAPLPGIRSRA